MHSRLRYSQIHWLEDGFLASLRHSHPIVFGQDDPHLRRGLHDAENLNCYSVLGDGDGLLNLRLRDRVSLAIGGSHS